MGLISRLFKKNPHGGESSTVAPSPGPDVASLVAEANEHFRMGRIAQAQQCYQRVVEIDPAHAKALYVLGGIALNDGNTAAAIDLVRRAIDSGSAERRFPFLARNRPGLHRAIRRCDTSAFKLQCDSDPTCRNGLAIWLRAMHAVGRHAEAVATSVTGTGQRPTDAQTYLDLGTTFQHLGRLQEAEAAFRKPCGWPPRAPARTSILRRPSSIKAAR